jgi:hypothetical protein
MLWKKSPQYGNMPHEQYMQTAEGKKSQQAFQQWGQWQQNNMPTPPKPGTGSPGGITNRYDGAGFAANGTPIAGDPRMRGQQPASSGGNFSAYSPGQAQPQRSPYATATSYGQQAPAQPGVQQPQGGVGWPPGAPPPQFNFIPGTPQSEKELSIDRHRQQAWGHYNKTQQAGAAQPQQNPYGTATPYGGKPQAMGPQGTQGGTNQQQPLQQYMTQGSPYGGGNQFQQRPAVDPNVANNPYANRPPPFQATTQNLDGTQSEMPNFQQRDAFISQINNQLGQMQNQSWQQPGMGAPQFNFPQMLGQAGEMAQQGFQNPFAQAGQGFLGQPYATTGGGGSPTPAPGLVPFVENQGMRSEKTIYVTAEEAGRRRAAESSRRFVDANGGGMDDNQQASIDRARQQVADLRGQQGMANGGDGLLGTLQQQSTPSMYNQQPAGMPQQGGISAQDLRIRPSVIYRQPDGSIGHQLPPGYGTGLGVARPATDIAAQREDGMMYIPPNPAPGSGGLYAPPGPVSPGTAQPIPPQSPGTPPGQTRPSASDQYQEQIDQLTSQMRGDGADRGSLQRQIDYYKQQQKKARDRGGAKAAPSPRPSGTGSSDMDFLAADPNLTPRQKSEKFLAANQQAIKRGTFRHSDIDALGLSGPEARLLKNKATVQGRSWERLRKADETAKLFPQLERGLNQLYAGYGRR